MIVIALKAVEAANRDEIRGSRLLHDAGDHSRDWARDLNCTVCKHYYALIDAATTAGMRMGPP